MSPRSSSSSNSVNETVQQEDINNNKNRNVTRHFFFLSSQAARELPHYVYRGSDLSLLYKYVLSPLADFCVQRLTPVWLAPNTITFVGLLFMLVSYLIHWYYVPDLVPHNSDDIPRWIFLFNGIAILVYQTLDNMDGKQARRTGSSSPLGLLFDHGCDAINSVFGSANWMIGMALHPVKDAWLCWSILFGPYALFYVGTWEEHYTGELVMPIFNGPNEGLMGGALLSFTSFLYGAHFWQSTSFWEVSVRPFVSLVLPGSFLDGISLRNADLLVLMSNFGFIQETVSKTISVGRTFGVKSLVTLSPFVILVISSLIVGFYDYNIWLEMPRTTLHLFAGLFVEMTTELMLAHVSNQPFQPFRSTILPLVLLTISVWLGLLTHGAKAQEILLIYCSCVCTYTIFRLVVLIDEISSVLNIWCFDITKPKYSTLISELHRKEHKKIR